MKLARQALSYCHQELEDGPVCVSATFGLVDAPALLRERYHGMQLQAGVRPLMQPGHRHTSLAYCLSTVITLTLAFSLMYLVLWLVQHLVK